MLILVISLYPTDIALGHLEGGLIGHSGLDPVLFSNFITSSTAFRTWKGRLASRDYKPPVLTHPHLDRLQEPDSGSHIGIQSSALIQRRQAQAQCLGPAGRRGRLRACTGESVAMTGGGKRHHCQPDAVERLNEGRRTGLPAEPLWGVGVSLLPSH